MIKISQSFYTVDVGGDEPFAIFVNGEFKKLYYKGYGTKEEEEKWLMDVLKSYETDRCTFVHLTKRGAKEICDGMDAWVMRQEGVTTKPALSFVFRKLSE